MKARFLLPALILLVLIFAPFLLDRETKALNENSRATLGGSFVKLSDGYVHYEWKGPASGKVVVFVHGFTMPYFIFDSVAGDLNRAGFRTLQFDLYGRGFSDRPETIYNPDLFDREMTELFGALEIKKPVFLVGTSMGGIVTTTFALRHREKVAKLILIAPAGFPIEIPVSGRIGRLPLVGDYIMKTLGDTLLLRGTLTSFYGKPPEDFLSRFEQAASYRGFKRAILSSLRNMPLESSGSLYENLGKSNIPLLLIWGQDDRVVSFSLSDLARKLLPRARFAPLEHIGHVPHYEAPDRVAPLILNFIK